MNMPTVMFVLNVAGLLFLPVASLGSTYMDPFYTMDTFSLNLPVATVGSTYMDPLFGILVPIRLLMSTVLALAGPLFGDVVPDRTGP